MEWLTNINWQDGFGNGRFFWIEWHFWKVVGWLGNAVFFSRFFVQWYATERLKRVVVPTAFWWLSLLGSLLLLSYALCYQRDSVFIFAYAFTWIPYIRNLIIHRRHKEAHLDCPRCGEICPPHSNFCFACGTRLAVGEAASK
ncbi:MAG: lipid-A-disaccharide synthase N-terminal domain-containing protein [Verrucomicrobia bacterium]|jgi:lipid-A-disaccharide synthase-like uncharacterized protein|nr:lipid-A-disaccharide synthase N-terminal domain-containing protein [Verrucomicrobiota bacterium]